MIGIGADPRTWRPQRFGQRNVKTVRAPLIEPLWTGVRVLAELANGALELRDQAGTAVSHPKVEAGLVDGLRADSAVLDGYLSPEAARSGVGVYSGPAPDTPSPGQFARQLVVGGGRSRRSELVEALESRTESPAAVGEPVAFVAIDLLLVDGESLLDVPLLERKRLLDGVIVENELVRIGIHVREPVDSWIGTWRNLGFRQLAYKDPNGRYRPGESNEGWATAQIPRS